MPTCQNFDSSCVDPSCDYCLFPPARDFWPPVVREPAGISRHWISLRIGTCKPTVNSQTVRSNVRGPLRKYEDLFGFDGFAGCDFAVFSGGLENYPELVRRLGELVPVLGTAPEQLERLIDPNQAPVVANAIRNGGGCAAITKSGLGDSDDPTDWLRKRLGASGGWHVRVAESEDVHREITEYVYQQKVSGELLSGVFVADSQRQNRNCELLGLTRQLVGETRLGAAPFAHCGSIGPLRKPAAMCEVITNIGQAIATEFAIKGVFGIDFLVNAAGVWPVDINPRIPSSAELIELSKLANDELEISKRREATILGRHVAACLETGQFGCESGVELKLPESSTKEMLGKAILFLRMPHELKIHPVIFERLLVHHWNALRGRLPLRWIADIPCLGTTIQSGDPVLTLLVRGDSELEVGKRLMQYAEELESLLAWEMQV